MAEDFSQRTSPIAVLRSILAGYPFSAGILKEIIQNSEDARATKQVFILDRRTHPSGCLYHANLASTQGPALVFFNDATFAANDWTALQNMFQSSKVSDSTKIGKFGIGFRSVFHLTDCPQILSGKGFALFDPLQAFTQSEGKKLSTEDVVKNYPDHIQSILPSSLNDLLQDGTFQGTIIRCPLRTSLAAGSDDVYGGISNEIVGPDRIAKILADFVMQGLGDIALFLQNLQKITIIDIDENGATTTNADVVITRHDPVWTNDTSSVRKVDTVISRMSGLGASETWVMADCRFPEKEASQLLSQRVIPNIMVAPTIHRHKLNAMVTLAIRAQSPNDVTGRLFTHLPLPITTSFNTHINAVFALTSDRQHLLNAEDGGVAPGSSDDILRQWNNLLFDHFIPQAWKQYLQYIASTADNSETIYASWPTTTAGGYWKNVPSKLLELVVASNMIIWPIYSPGNHRTDLKALNSRDILVAGPPDPATAIDALAALGMDVILLPQGIWSLVQHSNMKGINFMKPTTAHAALLGKPSRLSSASASTLDVVLRYLLSDGNIQNLVGLPIIPHASLGYLSLQTKNSHPFYTLLDNTAARLFNEFDAAHNIALDKLPSDAASLILKHGPGVLNVEVLSNHKVIFYLNTFLQRVQPASPSSSTVSWLLAFWEWLADWKDSKTLLWRIEDMNLIPCSDGLKAASQPIFKPQAIDETTVGHLKALSFSFVHRSFYSWKLSSVYKPKDPTDIHAIIDALPSMIPTHLARSTAEGILHHIANYATSSARKEWFTPTENRKLRSLPLYSIVDKGKSNLLTSVPPLTKIQFVDDPPAYLPSLPNTVFVKLSLNLSSQLADHLAPASDRISTEQLLDLALDHFNTQTPEVCLSVLRYIERNRLIIAPRITAKLSNTPFLQVGATNATISPSAAIDPLTSLARLFENGNPQLPLQIGAQSARLQCLHNIGLMHRSLTTAMLSERIKYISQQDSSSIDALRLSRDLLLCLQNRNTDFSLGSVEPTLANHQSLPWLPTHRGLACPEGTWDTSDTTPRHLYDQVLLRLDLPDNNRIDPALKRFLGWDKPLPQAVIIKQFACVLSSEMDLPTAIYDRYDATTDIITELSRRSLSSTEWNKLKSLTAGRCWVPTVNETLVNTQDAIFDTPIPNSGFFRIKGELSREFMMKLGCMTSPSAAAIICKLQALLGQRPTLERVTAGIHLLGCLPDVLSEDERNAIVIPDATMIFRPLCRTKYDDVYGAISTMPSDDLGEYFAAHPLLNDRLAHKLGLDRLGLHFATTFPGLSMGADPLAQIQNVLKGYDPRQFLIEFVANAVDAKAKRFSAMINEYVGNVQYTARVVSPSTMSELVKGPSIVIHNDSVFEDRDFTGICETSVGGKAGISNTIGRFGLGSATMFYFCEVAMIISRGRVLFLNPSGRHLPKRQTALILSLNQVRVLYPDHLASLDGIFDFDASLNTTGDYNGTLFVLPLRTRLAESRTAYSQAWDSERIQRKVFEPFLRDMASNCLLFTDLETIEVKARERSGTEYSTCICSAQRIRLTPTDTSQSTTTVTYSCRDVKIILVWGLRKEVTNWRVVQQLGLPVPEDLLVGGYRFQNPAAAGIAARLGARQHSAFNFHYFSTLPLPIPTSLGVHVMASFYLSPDRRSIRMDKSDAGDSKYNLWLLRDIIPPLYLFLLESLATNGATGNKSWWPKVSSNQSGDYLCGEMVESFYSDHLPNSPRYVFNSVSSPQVVLCPQEAIVLQSSLPAAIGHVINYLKPYRLVSLGAQATDLIQKHAKTSLTYVTPEFLREQILKENSTFCQLLSPSNDKATCTGLYAASQKSQTNAQMLQEIYNYLSASNLRGMPILALSNNIFVAFEQASSPRQYFAWPTKPKFYHNFTPNRFIHPQLDQPSMSALKLNVTMLGAPEMVKLIGETISKCDIFRNVPSATADWISDFWQFWDSYQGVGLQVEHIQGFPLIPTISPDRYVSLEACQASGAAVLIHEHSFNAALGEALAVLDLSVVIPSPKIGPAAYEILQHDQYPLIKLEKLVRSLQNTNILQRLGNQQPLHLAFATWARDLVTFDSKREARIEGMARMLPVWPTATNSQISLQSANDTYMLPDGVKMGLASQFMAKPLSQYGSLQYLKGPKIEHQSISGLLAVNGRIVTDELELQNYRDFINSWIERIPRPSQVSLYIPNLVGEFKPTATLYARDKLFLDAFGNDSKHFTSSVLWSLEGSLRRYGLKKQSDLDFVMFVECVNAIDKAVCELPPNDSTPTSGLCDRATAVFKVYATDMAIIAHKHGAQKARLLSQLDELAFIPRRMATRRIPPSANDADGIKIPENITSLPHIVKPSILVREEFEAVAWTQRACFKEQPDECILPIYDKLGKPSMLEVVMHLESLRDVSKAPGLTVAQKAVIIEDIKSSYMFLTNRVLPDGPANGDSLPSDISSREIFLNIKNPSDQQEWTWRSAQQLIYTDKDDDDHVFGVKPFLADYQKLLIRAGVLTEFQPLLPTNKQAPQSTGTDGILRGRFNDLWQSQQFTDIVIETVNDLGDSVFFQAHRVFLAASSNDPTGLNLTNLQAVNGNLPALAPRHEEADAKLFSESAVSYLLNNIYSTEFRLTPKETPLPCLLEAFLLAYRWRIDDVFASIELQLIKSIKPRTLGEIRKMALRCSASNLIPACDQYSTHNKLYVDRVLGEF